MPGSAPGAAWAPGRDEAAGAYGASWPRRARVSGGRQGLGPEEFGDGRALRGHRAHGKRVEKRTSVGARAQARIENRDHAPVRVRADQPAEALSQLEHRRGQRVLAEPVAAE